MSGHSKKLSVCWIQTETLPNFLLGVAADVGQWEWGVPYISRHPTGQSGHSLLCPTATRGRCLDVYIFSSSGGGKPSLDFRPRLGRAAPAERVKPAPHALARNVSKFMKRSTWLVGVLYNHRRPVGEYFGHVLGYVGRCELRLNDRVGA